MWFCSFQLTPPPSVGRGLILVVQLASIHLQRSALTYVLKKYLLGQVATSQSPGVSPESQLSNALSDQDPGDPFSFYMPSWIFKHPGFTWPSLAQRHIRFLQVTYSAWKMPRVIRVVSWQLDFSFPYASAGNSNKDSGDNGKPPWLL